MARSMLRQIHQIRPSDLYDDTLNMSTAEDYAGLTTGNLELDLNYLRTQEKIITGMPNWFDPPEDDFNLLAIHDKRFILWKQKMDDVSVPASQNYVLLTGTTKPSENIAIGATALGATVAQLSGAIGANDLTVASGNLNVLEIRNADTNLPIFTAEINGQEQQIYGLLQVGADATDGNAFGDTSSDDQAQISFIYFDPVTEAATAAPVSAIEGLDIEYQYKYRTDFYSLPERAFDQQVRFVDAIGIEIIDLQDAYDNGDGTILMSSAKNLHFDLNGNAEFELVDDTQNILTTDSANTTILAGYDVFMQDQGEIQFGEATINGTDYVGFKAPADLSDTTTVYTWPAADGNADDVLMTDGSAILSWDNPQKNCKKMSMIYSGSAISADTSISISGGAGWTIINPDSLTLGASGTFFAKDYDVFLNGALQLMGADASANHDCYYVDSANLAFEFNITNGDIITIIQRKKSNA